MALTGGWHTSHALLNCIVLHVCAAVCEGNLPVVKGQHMKGICGLYA